MQFPVHPVSVIDIYPVSTSVECERPFISDSLSAGFPSPALDFNAEPIDLNKELIRNPVSTFYGRIRGDSMVNAGIGDGDLIVIDKSISLRNGKIAVCFIDGEFTVKHVKVENNGCWLMPANDKYPPIQVTAANDFHVWGIVTHVIKSF